MNHLDEEIIAKFLMGKCTEHELQQVNAWIKASEDNAHQLFRMEQIYHLGRENYIPNEKKTNLAEKRLMKQLAGENARRNKVIKLQTWMKYAAVIAVIILSGGGIG